MFVLCLWHQSEKLSSACGSRATFLCVARETWPKERPLRFRASQASCLRGSRAGYGVCRQGIGQLLLRCLNSGIHALAVP